jgi:hypothetical protein
MGWGALGFDIGLSVASIYDADGFLGVQVDAYGEQQSGVRDYELHAPFGFLSRPLDPSTDAQAQPVATGACQVLYAMEGGRGHAWLSNDPRVIPLLPKLDKGGSIQYCATLGSFAKFSGTGAYQVQVASGQTITLQTLGGVAVTIGPTGITIGNGAQPVALAPALLQYLQVIAQAIVAIAAASCAAPGSPLVSPALAALLPSIKTPPNLTAQNLMSA